MKKTYETHMVNHSKLRFQVDISIEISKPQFLVPMHRGLHPYCLMKHVYIYICVDKYEARVDITWNYVHIKKNIETTQKNKCFQNCLKKKKTSNACLGCEFDTIYVWILKATSPSPASSIAIKIDTAHHLHDLGDKTTHQRSATVAGN